MLLYIIILYLWRTYMTQQEYDKLKTVQMEIMDVIHDLCVKHNIKYYIIGGTLLGAVRHGGFIPWDIDIDIAMPRTDYTKFKEVCRTELKEGYKYRDHTTNKKYYRPHALVCKENTELYAKYDLDNKRYDNFGIYIDIFPLDNAPDSQEDRNAHIKQIEGFKKFKRFRIPYVYSHSLTKKLLYKFIMLLLCWYPEKKVNVKYHQILQKYNSIETNCLCSMSSGYPYYKQCMSRNIYGVPTLMKFESREYYAPEKPHEYLSQLYGDYMKLPPEEKRQANFEIFTHVKF
ncbi:MAG: LicD family protein [Ruminococcaceae bacterium]|nr:LicD family protein [Oscillospiraceae bacterium]